jgi:hypothetical protein
MEGEEMKKNESPMEGIPVPEVAVATEELPDTREKQPGGEDPQDVYQLMDQRDEAQIVAALEGRYLDDFVYEVDSGGDKVVGLSWIGIQEASRAYGGIQCRILEERETKTHVIVTVEAKDMKTGSARVGRSRQALLRRLPSGKLQMDPFGDVKAISKAQRNAIRQLLPQVLMKQWIDRYRSRDNEKPENKQSDNQATTPSMSSWPLSNSSRASRSKRFWRLTVDLPRKTVLWFQESDDPHGLPGRPGPRPSMED